MIVELHLLMSACKRGGGGIKLNLVLANTQPARVPSCFLCVNKA